MRCPSCGAIIKKRSMKCPECGAFRNKSWVESPPSKAVQTQVSETMPSSIPVNKERMRPSPSLIEFPGVGRNSIPQWRKELGERVREVQERRAREATLEETEVEAVAEDEFKAAPVLELLPQAELPAVNPLVAAALQRIERANGSAKFAGGNAALANAVATFEEQPEFGFDVSASADESGAFITSEEENGVNGNSSQPERAHNLTVVSSPAASLVDRPARPKPKRLIHDVNDPALNYLDALPTTTGLEVRQNTYAPIAYRILSGIVDLLVVSLLSAPVVGLINYMQLNWQDFRVIAFAAGSFVIFGFLYFTISTALTGRTLGMRLFSLRVVDARTGLIPTGTQSAGRALVYMLSIASAGIALMFTFLDREGHTPHDRFSRTAVIRV